MSVPTAENWKANILVVDDTPVNIDLLSDTLILEGYEMRGLIDSTKALEIARSMQPDLILLDIMMPELNGYQVCEQLKADPLTQNIPIIFLSSKNNIGEKVKGFNLGAVDYITKPFQIEEVLLRIKNQLKFQAAQAQVYQLNTELEKRIQERTAQLEAANQELKHEINERKQVAKMLKDSEEKLESILNSLEEVVWSADIQTRQLIFLNPAAQKVYGRSLDELLANPQLRLETIHPQDRHLVERTVLASELPKNIDIEYRIVQPDGKVRWVWERSRLVYDAQGIASRQDGIICDITERKLVEGRLSYEAKHDSLTGLPNRLNFIERVEQALEKSKSERHYLFAVLFIDLDRFKVVNDSLGHLLGDELLITVAQILQSCIRSQDFVARLGGDEFTILLDAIQTVEDAKLIAKRIHKKLAAPFELNNHILFTSASIGIVVGDAKYEASADILRNADIAMYSAKSSGKARHEVFDQQMYAQTIEQLNLENDLRKAVLRNELVLHYQPIISLKKGTLSGFEALLRWQHPEKGLIYPDKFIQIAEETGLIIPIGEWVLQEACHQLKAWQQEFTAAKNLTMGVNLASQQIKVADFLAKLDITLAQYQFAPNTLHLEITESTLMDYRQQTIDLFTKIRNRGIELSIDDFGTGYSSLQYLNRFPINTLKIDRSFVQGMLSERENFEIVKTILTLARTLKMNVIAEGIETLKQLKVLKTLNCKFGQGYLFAKPLTPEDVELLLENPIEF